MKKIMKFSAILTFALFPLNTNLMASSYTISETSQVYKSNKARASIRQYYNLTTTPGKYKTTAIGVSYANEGGYVIKSAILKIKRKSNNTIVYSSRRTTDISIGEAYIWSVHASTKLKKGETYTLDIKYKISLGDTKHCRKTFTFGDNEEAMWLVKSKGTTLNKNGCRGIAFKTK